MSKEMTVIVLGVWVIIVPYLGIPGAWRTALLVLTGIGIAVIGFLLRGEALGRPGRTIPRASHATFTESSTPAPILHDHQEGITSLN